MDLKQLGWNEGLERAWGETCGAGLSAGRVAREDRAGYVVYGARRALRAVLRGALRHAAEQGGDRPAVGDWVALRAGGAVEAGESWGEEVVQREAAVIERVLPRGGCIRRIAAGRSGQAQIIAANVDALLICTALDRDFSPRRVERYLTLAYAGGVRPVIVLTKADVSDDAAEQAREMEAVAPDAAVVLVSALQGTGLERVRSHVGFGQSAVLAGSSGVGKSTLINALLGREAMATGAVRGGDGRGRHTTTHRQLMLLPGGGVLIDTPGMREVQLPASAGAVAETFGEVERLSSACRFRDCGHDGEPGCAVRAALESGALEAARFSSWQKQLREQRWLERREDPEAAAAERAKWRAIGKAAKRWTKRKYGEADREA